MCGGETGESETHKDIDLSNDKAISSCLNRIIWTRTHTIFVFVLKKINNDVQFPADWFNQQLTLSLFHRHFLYPPQQMNSFDSQFSNNRNMTNV